MADKHTKYGGDFQELVFENRNKLYGAYDLRTIYKSVLTKAFLIGVALFVALILPVLFVGGGGKAKEKVIEIDTELLENKEAPEKEKEEEKKKDEIVEEKKNEQSIQDLAKKIDDIPQQTQVQDLVPSPKKDPPVETPAKTAEETQGKVTGTKDVEGEKTNIYDGDQRRDGVEGGQGNQSKKENTEVVQHKVDPKEIVESVDVLAEFSAGGENGFRQRVAENFDNEAVEGEGVLTTEVSFVVELDGSISQVKAKGSNSDFNREAERAVRSIRTKWKPGKQGNQNVRSRFRLPLKMKFES